MSDNTEASESPVASMLSRRSVKRLTEPGPSAGELELIVTAATTVPDHNEQRPWRFVVVTGSAREAFGEALEAAGVEAEPDLAEPRRRKLREKAFAAPTFVVIVFSPKPGTVARWEQQASAAASGYAMSLAAHLLGVGAIWKSASVRRGRQLAELLELTDEEQLMGWVNLGTPVSGPQRRNNPVTASDVTTRLTDDGLVRWDQGSSVGHG